MKKKLLICLMLICELNMFAQLHVDSNGNTKMSRGVAVGAIVETVDTISLNVVLPPIAPSKTGRYGVYASQKVPIYDQGEYSEVGIVGHVKDPYGTTANLPVENSKVPRFYRFHAGIAGVAEKGVAVFGTTASTLPPSWILGNYAGFFCGAVRVSGTLTATTITTSSDVRFKENISAIDKQFSLDALSKLNPISYTFKKDNDMLEVQEGEGITHYGMIAQEVQAVLPELVHEDGAGYLSVNYIEFIPLLIQAVRTQQKQIEELKSIINDGGIDIPLPSPKKRGAYNYSNSDIAVLYQNSPNPFSLDTKIEYELPSSTLSASLYVYNMNGLQIAEYPIEARGKGFVIIEAGHMEAGMYLYSLIADGQVIDTKRMILTK